MSDRETRGNNTTARPEERAVLVGVVPPGSHRARVDEYLQELALLADSAGAVVSTRVVQERDRLDPALYIGKGKAEEIAFLVQERDLQLVIFDDDLSPVQVRNLEKIISCKIVDRSGLILDIFASRARTSEAKTQVELAQLQYMLPRLTRQWTHLSKQFGGIGTKGPGETQIETDRRAIRTKITHLRARLARIAQERETQRKGRSSLPRAALVGYTNAGKSTLLNFFAHTDVPVEDRLFATLDSTVRLVKLSSLHTLLLSDTVGFIRKLPHHLVASFKSTLDEVREADILLHVIDVSHPSFAEQISVVNETLQDLDAVGKPVMHVFNKIDALANRSIITSLTSMYPNAVFVSASRGINMGQMEEQLRTMVEGSVEEVTLQLRHGDQDLVARIHSNAEVLDTRYAEDGVTIRFRIRRNEADRIRALVARRRATTTHTSGRQSHREGGTGRSQKKKSPRKP
jgi:GTPase